MDLSQLLLVLIMLWRLFLLQACFLFAVVMNATKGLKLQGWHHVYTYSGAYESPVQDVLWATKTLKTQIDFIYFI